MLADPVTGIAGSFVKLAEDSQSGSVYSFPLWGDFIRVSVKHTVPAPGKTGVFRHLISVTYPNALDNGSTEVFNGTYATVNLTITNSNSVPFDTGSARLALLELLKFISNGTTISAFGDAVLVGAF